MNAFQIQQTLKGTPYVSIPWIQRSFDLTYSQAKEFLAQLQLRVGQIRRHRGSVILCAKRTCGCVIWTAARWMT